MGEINEALGIGKKFMINGKEYMVNPAPIEELEELMEKKNKVITMEGKFAWNYVSLPKEKPEIKKERIDAIMYILDRAFGGSLKPEVIGKIDRVTAEEIIKFFLGE